MTSASSPGLPTLETMGREQFVSLSTYRKDGSVVATPVWVASTPEGLVVTTPAGSHKVTRLRARPEATLQPCTRSGKVEAGAPLLPVTVEIVEPDDQSTTAAAVRALSGKYGLMYKMITGVEKLMTVARRTSGERVILRLT
ncbi:PPOX class F420-dependent oxidoreductase [Dermatophilaceae bacterium Soc4.6]